jgi:hypothetical protein
MSDKKFNFNLGNRRLTAEESNVVENAKRLFRESLERHRGAQAVAANAIFKATSNATAAASVSRPLGKEVVTGKATPNARGTDVVGSGSSSWSTNKVAPTHRRY